MSAMTRAGLRIRAGALLSLIIASGLGSSDAIAGKIPATADFLGADWAQTGGDSAETHFSNLSSINVANVTRLGLAWSFSLDTTRGQESTPIVVKGIMYVSTAWSKVFALEAATGQPLWSYDPKVPGPSAFKACCDVVNRGVAVAQGRVFVATLDGRLIALDAESGKELWVTQTVDLHRAYAITGAPRVFRNTVLIGNAGGEYGVRGYVTAYDLSTGRQQWRFYTVPGKPGAPDGAISDSPLEVLALPTWSGHWYEYGGGGTVWDSIVFDEQFNQIYIGVGNGTPWDRRVRSDGRGDNLFLASIVALDADTGSYRWHYQESPGESWDFDATQGIVLTALNVNGHTTPVLMQASKNGFYYVLDRKSGKLVSARNFVPENWTTGIDLATGRPITNSDIFYPKPHVMLPSAIGAHSWQSMAFDPIKQVAYIPAVEMPLRYASDQKFHYRSGAWNTGIDLSAYVPPADPAARKAMNALARGELVAWDPVAQKARWRVRHDSLWNGGVLATAGGLVFQGQGNGSLDAYQAKTGANLWSFRGPSGIIAAPITYSVEGTQYIAVVTGWGGILLNYPQGATQRLAPPGRVLVFKLDGADTLTTTSLQQLPKPNPADKSFTVKQIADGKYLYALNCGFCHGPAAAGGDVLPDLRRATALPSDELWQAIVIGGALESGGMVGFKQYLSVTDAESIRAYVSEQAKILQVTNSNHATISQ